MSHQGTDLSVCDGVLSVFEFMSPHTVHQHLLAVQDKSPLFKISDWSLTVPAWNKEGVRWFSANPCTLGLWLFSQLVSTELSLSKACNPRLLPVILWVLVYSSC